MVQYEHWKRFCFVILLGVTVWATATTPASSSPSPGLSFGHPDLLFMTRAAPLGELPEEIAEQEKQVLAALGVEQGNGFFDLRGGPRLSTMIITRAMLPGPGVNNYLEWPDFGFPGGPPDEQVLEQLAWRSILDFVKLHQEELRLDPAQLESSPNITVHDGGDMIQIFARRTIRGVPVLNNALSAVIKKGNLILFGVSKWGDIDPNILSNQALSGDEAEQKAASFLAGLGAEVTGSWREPELVIVPAVAGGVEADDDEPYFHELVWIVSPLIDGETGSWEYWVKAKTGDTFVGQNLDRNLREVEGGVYPLTNDPAVMGGTETSYPMPSIDLSDGLAMTFTDHGGFTSLFPAPTPIATTLDGMFVGIEDACATAAGTTISVGTSAATLDLGSSGGTNCVFPTGTSEGNTHAARTTYYHLNRLRETAIGQLPTGIPWLTSHLTANTNEPASCNGRWSVARQEIDLFQSDPTVPCANGGEIATRIAHEWGHGLDDNDTNMVFSRPGEGIADFYAALRFNDSCMFRGMFQGTNCGGFGNPCTSCDGARDIDYLNHVSPTPRDPLWAATCPAVPGAPPPPAAVGPCTREPHCEGFLTAQALWGFLKQDLPSVYGLDDNTAREVATRLTYQAAGMVDDWFECSTPFGGCLAGSGYMQFLAADDDNGTLSDETPHWDAIFDAFDRHGIACQLVTMAGPAPCSTGPTTAPNLTVIPGDRIANLSWTAVPNAVTYQIFRTEGVFGCDFGKILVGEVPGTSFTDTGLKNGREYSYIVIAVGTAPQCTSPASLCETVTPVPPPPSTCGDCNSDGAVDILDALAAASHAAGTVLLTGPNLMDCDVDGNGGVTIVDALVIAQTASGLPTTLQCPVCRDCNNDGIPGDMADFGVLGSLVGTDVTTPLHAACDVNGDKRIDAADLFDWTTTAGCVTCGDSDTNGTVDAGDTPFPMTPMMTYPFLPRTRQHAASDIAPAIGTVDAADEMAIDDYVAGTTSDLVCDDPQAVSPRPRLHAFMGSFCVSGTSNGTPFDIVVTGPTAPAAMLPGLTSACDADCIVGFLLGQVPVPYAATPSTVGPACFDVVELPAAPVVLTVDGCDPVSTPAGCPFG